MMVRTFAFSLVIAGCAGDGPRYVTDLPDEPPTAESLELTMLQHACIEPFLVARVISDEVVACSGPRDPRPESVPISLRQVEVLSPLDAMVGLSEGTTIWMSSVLGDIIKVVPTPSDSYPTVASGDELFWINVRHYTNSGTYNCNGVDDFYRAEPNRLQIRSVSEIPAVMDACENDIIVEDDSRVLKELTTDNLRVGEPY